MSIAMRKVALVTSITGIMFLANAYVIASWLDKQGIIAVAVSIQSEYLTGTALTIIAALLLLGGSGAIWVPRCQVCRHLLLRRGRYCGACGSRL